jgi:hypothetical protein
MGTKGMIKLYVSNDILDSFEFLYHREDDLKVDNEEKIANAMYNLILKEAVHPDKPTRIHGWEVKIVKL